MKAFSFVLASCLAFVFGMSGLMAEDLKHTQDSLPVVKANVKEKKAILVDVREQGELDEGHVQDAVLLPLSQLKSGTAAETLKQLPKDKILYTYCKVGARSLTAAGLLQKQGYQVRALKPGYQDLVQAGFPSASGK